MDPPDGAWYQVPEDTAPRGRSALERMREHPAAAIAAASMLALAVALGGVLMAASAAGPRVEIGLSDDATGGSDDTANGTGAGGSAEGGTIVVDVAGAVRSPGLYRLPAGSRVGDAIAAAGGYGPMVDAAAVARDLNLAAPLSDGEKVVVPDRASEVAPTKDGGEGASGLVDLNRASAEALDALPGIGPVTVQRIIDARAERPFATADELLERKIVGPATWEKIRDLVTVS